MSTGAHRPPRGRRANRRAVYHTALWGPCAMLRREELGSDIRRKQGALVDTVTRDLPKYDVDSSTPTERRRRATDGVRVHGVAAGTLSRGKTVRAPLNSKADQ
jgi:hypothetical protein